MSDISRAQMLYEDFCSIDCFKLGPFVFLNEQGKRKADALRPSIVEELKEIRILEERIVSTPSPWHAALFLLAFYNYFIKFNELPIRKDNNIFISTSTSALRPIFRGHPDSKWEYNLTPKSERPTDNKAIETCELVAFCALLTRLFMSTDLPSPPIEALIATAQHYGLSTPLLDFTADPLVAVYFGANGKQKRNDQEGVVFALTLRQALGLGAKIILPPPFVKRLYIQRGLFIEIQKDTISALRKACIEIRFPLNKSFKVIRQHNDIDLLVGDLWLEKAVNWAKKWASIEKVFPTDPKKAEQVFYEAFKQIGYPNYLNRLIVPIQLAMWVDFTSELLYWLAIIVDSEKEWFDLEILNVIVRNNSSLMKEFAASFEAEAIIKKRSGEAEQASAKMRLAQIIREALAEFDKIS